MMTLALVDISVIGTAGDNMTDVIQSFQVAAFCFSVILSFYNNILQRCSITGIPPVNFVLTDGPMMIARSLSNGANLNEEYSAAALLR